MLTWQTVLLKEGGISWGWDLFYQHSAGQAQGQRAEDVGSAARHTNYFPPCLCAFPVFLFAQRNNILFLSEEENKNQSEEG